MKGDCGALQKNEEIFITFTFSFISFHLLHYIITFLKIFHSEHSEKITLLDDLKI